MLIILIFVSNLILVISQWQCPTSNQCSVAPYTLLIDNLLCSDECPSTFNKVCDPNQGNLCTACTLPNSFPALFELEFWKIQDLSTSSITSSVDSTDIWSNPSNVPFISKTSSPLPTRSRGFYFFPAASMTSNQNYIPSLYFTAAVWFVPMANGQILSAKFGSRNYIELNYAGGKFYLRVWTQSLTLSQAMFQASSQPTKSWWYVAMQLQQTACNTMNIRFWLINDGNNNAPPQTPFSNHQAIFLKQDYIWTVGKSSADSFTGFLYWLKAWNVNHHEHWNLDITQLCSITVYDTNTCVKCDVSSSNLGCGYTCTIDDQNNGDCTSCYSKQCRTCYGYSFNMCSDCYNGAVPTCCDWLASACTSTWNSLTCNTNDKFLINGVCLYAIPYGFVNNLPVNDPVINADFTKSFAGIYDNILVTGDSQSRYNYWNNPENVDPKPAKQRGLYFTPNVYLKAKINLSHTISFGVWVYCIDVMNTQTFASYTGNHLKLYSNGDIDIKTDDFTGNFQTTTSSAVLNNGGWVYISFSIEYSSSDGNSHLIPYGSNIQNTQQDSLGIFRPEVGGSLFLGSDEFTGFISHFQLWQTVISNFNPFYSDYSSDPDTSVFWRCDFNSYYDGTNCIPCLNSCTKGCVKADSCNICDSEYCLQCISFESNSCSGCVKNRSPPSCECSSGFYLPAGQTECSPCYTGCSQCTGSFYYQCISCFSSYYYFSALQTCLSGCPLGYSDSANGCLFNSELVFDLNLNTLSGVIYDAASSIPVITGSSEQFYPNYEEDDPIGAYLRGFYFNGKSSVMRLPEYNTYISPTLKIGPIFTISIWLNIENENSAVISKNDISNGYSTIYTISLVNAKPTIQILINQSLILYTSQTQLNAFEWSHIALQLNIDSNWNSVATWYVNAHSSFSLILGLGYFQDISSNTISLIGAKKISQDISNFFQGFLYKIQIYNKVHAIELLSQTSCNQDCHVCDTTKSCIPNCQIKDFWLGPKYNDCLNCSPNCLKGCKDNQIYCSLCMNPLCDKCTDYSANGCKTCKTNASFQENSCTCNLGYNGTEICNYVPFSVKLLVSSDDNLFLDFSSPLQNPLTKQDFKISIDNNPEFTWSLAQEKPNYYSISTTIKSKIEKNTMIIIEFFDLTKVKSIYNGILTSSTVSSKLNEYIPSISSLTVVAITDNTATAVQAAILGSVFLSYFNPNPSSLWGLLSCLQILTYLALSGIPFSEKILAFFSNLNPYDLLPNFFEYIIDEKQGNAAYSEAVNFGYDTDLILLNQGGDFFVIITSLFSIPFVMYLAGCSDYKVAKKFRKTFRNYKYGFFIRFWIQAYLELGAAAYVALKIFKVTNLARITNIIICFWVIIIFIITPLVFLWFCYKNQLEIKCKSKQFNSLFESFFYEFKTEKGFLYSLYYFVYFIRRLIYSANLVFLTDYPQAQVPINILCSLYSISYLLIYWPFEDIIIQISNLISEIMTCIVMCTTSFYLFDMSSNAISIVENFIIFECLLASGLQFGATVAIFVRTLSQSIRDKLIQYRSAKIKPDSTEESPVKLLKSV